jgi:hypothetical protein
MALATHRLPVGELAIGGLEISQDRYLVRSRTHEPGSYFELWASPWSHVRCTCLGFTCRVTGLAHASARPSYYHGLLPGTEPCVNDSLKSTHPQSWGDERKCTRPAGDSGTLGLALTSPVTGGEEC